VLTDIIQLKEPRKKTRDTDKPIYEHLAQITPADEIEYDRLCNPVDDQSTALYEHIQEDLSFPDKPAITERPLIHDDSPVDDQPLYDHIKEVPSSSHMSSIKERPLASLARDGKAQSEESSCKIQMSVHRMPKIPITPKERGFGPSATCMNPATKQRNRFQISTEDTFKSLDTPVSLLPSRSLPSIGNDGSPKMGKQYGTRKLSDGSQHQPFIQSVIKPAADLEEAKGEWQATKSSDCVAMTKFSIAWLPRDLSGLSIHQVGECLRQLNLGNYIDVFHGQQIDGQMLSDLDEDMLTTGHRLHHDQV